MEIMIYYWHLRRGNAPNDKEIRKNWTQFHTRIRYRYSNGHFSDCSLAPDHHTDVMPLTLFLSQVCSVYPRVWFFTGTSSSISGRGRAERGTPTVSPSCAPLNSVYWLPEWAASLNSVSVVRQEKFGWRSEGQSLTPPSIVNQCAPEQGN